MDYNATWESLYEVATANEDNWYRLKGQIATIRNMIDQTKDLLKHKGLDKYAFYMELDDRTVWASIDKNGINVDLESDSPKYYAWSQLPYRVILSVNKPIKYIALGKTHKAIPITEWKTK